MQKTAMAKQRYNVEEVAQFVENCLRHRSPADQAKWAGLPAKIRSYPFPYFLAAPGARIVDCAGFKFADQESSDPGQPDHDNSGE